MTHPTYPLRQLLLDDYRIDGIDQVMTPALAIYPDYVDNNISATLRLVGGDVNRFRPHVKTSKLRAVMAQYVARGVRQFKCATSLELTTLMDVGAEDVSPQPALPRPLTLIAQDKDRIARFNNDVIPP